MNFIRRIGRDEIYIKYVHQLVNVRLYMQTDSQLGLTTPFVDASSVAELCRSRSDVETALRPPRVGSQHVCWTYGRPWTTAAITFPSKGNSLLIDPRLSWSVAFPLMSPSCQLFKHSY